jgi:hypothetical protein
MTQLVLPDVEMNATAAVLKIDGLALMLPQTEVRALESASDVGGSDPAKKSIGWISYMRQRWPVYCLSEQLELLGSAPSSRRTCALLAIENGYIGVLCDDVSVQKQITGKSHELPLAMKTADTPVTKLIPFGGELMSVTSAKRLAAYIDLQVCKLASNKELPCLA